MAPRIVDILTTYTAYIRKKERFPRSIHIEEKETLRNRFLVFCFFVLLQNLTFLLSLEFSLRAQQDLLALQKRTIFSLLLEFSLSPKQDLDMDTKKSRLGVKRNGILRQGSST